MRLPMIPFRRRVLLQAPRSPPLLLYHPQLLHSVIMWCVHPVDLVVVERSDRASKRSRGECSSRRRVFLQRGEEGDVSSGFRLRDVPRSRVQVAGMGRVDVGR